MPHTGVTLKHYGSHICNKSKNIFLETATVEFKYEHGVEAGNKGAELPVSVLQINFLTAIQLLQTSSRTHRNTIHFPHPTTYPQELYSQGT